MDEVQIQQLLAQQQRMVELNEQLVNQIAQIAQKMVENDSDWVDADTALRLLGYSVNRNSRRRLASLRKMGLLTKFANQRPFIYNRAEVVNAKNEIERRKLYVPLR